MPRTGFDPSKHGFHFANGFEGKVAIVPGFGEVPTRGRGMAFAALDYWYTGLPVPTHRPDRPEQEVVLSSDPEHPYLESSVPGERWRGCFVQDYVPERPCYLDLAVSRGIWVNSWTPTLGRHFVAQFSARNYGDHPARLAELFMVVRGPDGERLDGLLGGDGDPTRLEPGAERALFKAVVQFGTVPGCYELTAAYRSEQGALIALPPAEPGTTSQVGVTAIAPPRRTRVMVTFAAVTVEEASGLDGRLSLGLAVGGRSRQWPEVDAIEVEDGKTFEVGEYFEQVLEPNEPLTVTVAGAGAGGESAGVVCERWLGLDGWGAGAHSYRSRTPVRDAPNGAGWAEGAYTIDFVIEATPPGEEAGP